MPPDQSRDFMLLCVCTWVVVCIVGFILAKLAKNYQLPAERERVEQRKRTARKLVLANQDGARQKVKDKMRPMIVDACLSCRRCNALALPIASASHSFSGDLYGSMFMKYTPINRAKVSHSFSGNRYRCMGCGRQFAGPKFDFASSVTCIMREEYEYPNQKIYNEMRKEFDYEVAQEITAYAEDPGVLFAEVSNEIARDKA